MQYKKNEVIVFNGTSFPVEQIIRYIDNAGDTVDVCMYMFTSRTLADCIVRAHRRRVKIRIFTDHDRARSDGSQIDFLRLKGLQIRSHRSPFIMHHKFVIIDKKILMTGSFNWTDQGAQMNFETVVVMKSNHELCLSRLSREFEKLWNMK